jgi:hypothetical protein
MHVTWIVSGKIERNPDGTLSSSMASIRYRVLPAADHLAKQGHRIDIIQAGLPADAPSLRGPLGADVVIISKGLFHECTAFVERAQRSGARVIFDVCDDHFDSPFRDNYFTLCRVADDIVASTPAMAQVIGNRAGRRAKIIGDPFEAPHGEPRFEPRDRLKLLWFGHPTNFDTLMATASSMIEFSRRFPTQLTVVSNDTANIRQTLRNADRRHSPHLTVRFLEWSAETTWRALAECDATVIPSLPTESKQVKSPNRLVESLRRGRFVAAYPLPAYQSFADYCWLSEQVTEGLQWALANPRSAVARIAAGQAFIVKECSPQRIVAQWETAISRYAASRPMTLAKPNFASVLAGSIANARL